MALPYDETPFDTPNEGNNPFANPSNTTADGLPVNLFTWLGDTQGKTVTLSMYEKYNNAVSIDPTGLISVTFSMNAATEKEDLLLIMEQVIQWNANNTPTPVTSRIDSIKTKLNKAVATDGVYDAWELVLFWTMAVKPSLFTPLILSDSVLNTYVMLAVEKNGGTLATRVQSDVSRAKNPNNPLPTPQPGSDTDNPNPTPKPGSSQNSNLAPWLLAVVIAIILILILQ